MMEEDKEKAVEVETEEVEKVIQEVDELPKAIVRRVVKDKLSDCSADGDLNVHKDALLAFSESARIFIHYLSATANDICKESRRQTIKAEDVLQALEEIEFPDLVGPLKTSLTEFKRRNSVKKAGASESKEVEKKKKVEQGTPKKKTVEEESPKKRKLEEGTPKKSGGKSKQKKKE
ncbi:DNA polymerase II subunit B4 [Euphorbia lathyris]|uniref:DNA polymerase II subunit B4 n=1 Tax=Euphorbia lathyris TaxID=212925 RepID=UPI003313B04A